MSENLEARSDEIHSINNDNSTKKKTSSIDMDKYNTYSNGQIDNNKKSNFGLDGILDIGKFNSRHNAYENDIKDRILLVDQLFDESINYDLSNPQEKPDQNNINEKKEDPKVHLFTESILHNSDHQRIDPFDFDFKNDNNFQYTQNNDNLNISNNFNKEKENNLNVIVSPLYSDIGNLNNYRNEPNNIDKNRFASQIFTDNTIDYDNKQNDSIDFLSARKRELKNNKFKYVKENFDINELNPSELKLSDRNFDAQSKKINEKKVKFDPIDIFNDEKNEYNYNSLPENFDENVKYDPIEKIDPHKSIVINADGERLTFNNLNIIGINSAKKNEEDMNEKKKDYANQFVKNPFQSINFDENNSNNHSEIKINKSMNVYKPNDDKKLELFPFFNAMNLNEINDPKIEILKSSISFPFNQSFDDLKVQNPGNENNAKMERNKEISINEIERVMRHAINQENPFTEAKSESDRKNSAKDENNFNLFDADESYIEKKTTHKDVLPLNNDEIDIEIDNDKLNEENNFNFNLGLTQTTKINYNDLEVKNLIINKNLDVQNIVDVNNFNSKDFNFNFDKISKKEKIENFFNDENFDFDLDSKIKNKPKLEIKVNDKGENKNMNILGDFDKSKNESKNFDFDFDIPNDNLNNPNNIINPNVQNNFIFSNKINNNTNFANNNLNMNSNHNNNINNNFNFEIKVNNPPNNNSKRIANGEFYNDESENFLSNKLSNRLPLYKEKKEENPSYDIMKKNENINFDKILFDVFEKNDKLDKKKVNFEKDFQSNNSNNNKIPPEYINLDEFQSGKMNEYNNRAVNRNAEIPREENINDLDSLYLESHRGDNLDKNGIFYSYSDKYEKPFSRSSNFGGNKKINYLKRKAKVVDDNTFSEEKALSKIKNNGKFDKYFNYDSDVLISLLESIFMDLFQNFDFDNLKKKLKVSSKDLRLKSESRIGYLTNIQTFKYNADLLNLNQIKLKILDTNLKYIREVRSDGNGFYRAFMFALIESYILNLNLNQLRYIVNDINELLDFPLTNNIEVNKLEIFGVFNYIMENIEMGEIGMAYLIFLNAYGYSANFDNGLVKYIRLAIKKFLTDHENEISRIDNFSYIKDTIPEEYFIDKKNIDLKSFIKERLLNPEYEADLNIICLAPNVFDIGLDMIVLEGANKQEFSEIKVFIQHFPNLSVQIGNNISSENLKLFYRLGRYSVLSSNQSASKMESLNKFDLNNYLNLDKFSEKINFISEFHCEICKKESHIIQIKKFNDLSFCSNCLQFQIKKTVKKRVKNFVQDNYLNKEYYGRSIIIDDRAKYMINDEDCMYIFKTTLTKMIFGKFEAICSVCQAGEGLVKLNCPCSFCDKCLGDYINKATDEKILLNQFEKKQSTSKISMNKNMFCPCGMLFDLELAITIKYPNQEVLYKKSQERLVNTCKNICLKCKKDYSNVKAKQNMPGDNAGYFILKVNKDNENIINNYDISIDDHLICKECISGVKHHLADLMRKKIIKMKDKTYPLDCNICDIVHNVNSTNLSKIMKSEGGCCEIL